MKQQTRTSKNAEHNPAGTKMARKAYYGQLAVNHPRGMRLDGTTVGSKKDK